MKIFQLYDNNLGAKRVKPEKYQVPNKELKKWLLILCREKVLVNGSLLKGEALEFTNQLNFESFQKSEEMDEKF